MPANDFLVAKIDDRPGKVQTARPGAHRNRFMKGIGKGRASLLDA
jgi:hypothetical protein